MSAGTERLDLFGLYTSCLQNQRQENELRNKMFPSKIRALNKDYLILFLISH